MLLICLFTFIWLFIGGYMHKSRMFFAKKPLKDKSEGLFPMFVVLSLLVKIVIAALYPGHKTDMGCFNGWSSIIFNEGLSGFYTSEGFHDYPPGYMYVLYVIGMIKNVFNISTTPTLLLKLPAIICDMLIGYVIYNESKEKFSNNTASILGALWLLNPAALVDSSFWGQVDSVYTLFIILYAVMLYKRQIIPAAFTFAVCILIKPQSLMLTPLILLAIFENYIYPKFDAKKLLICIASGIGAIGLLVLLSLPFGLKEVVAQYTNTIGSYPYATVNAFNFWGMIGKNWAGLTTPVEIIGYASIIIICVLVAVLFIKNKSQTKYYYLGAMLILGTFTFSTHMHERYAFAAMPLLLLAFAKSASPREFISYVVFSACQFFNYAWVLFIYEQDINKFFRSPVVNVASAINVAVFIAFAYLMFKEPQAMSVGVIEKKKPQVKKANSSASFSKRIALSKSNVKIDRADVIIIAVIAVVYGVIAFLNLGDVKAPTSVYELNSPVLIDLGEQQYVSEVRFFDAPPHIDENRTVNLKTFDKNMNIVSSSSVNSAFYVYEWNQIGVNQEVKYIEISSNTPPLNILELSVRDKEQKPISPANASQLGGLFDEQDIVPDVKSFMNGSYFDEIYHARSAKEFIDGTPIYEWTHPPLGKLIISVGIMIFGMNPFGWRFMGTLFGVLMVAISYIFIRKMFKNRYIAIFGCLMFTFDFMHFVQSRISTVDVYATTFIMLMYLFMFLYTQKSFYDTDVKKTLPLLAASGAFFGLSVACKWNSAYAAVGLALIFFYTLYVRYKEYCYAKRFPRAVTNGISHEHIINSFVPNTVKTIAWCILFFVIIPLVIYTLSYIPFMRAEGSFSLSVMLENQKDMFIYHSRTVKGSTHSFSSKWYEWLYMKRPVWFYGETYPDGKLGGISTFGNPALWWGGLVAVGFNIYYAFVKKDKKSAFLLVAYFSQLMFWLPIGRTTYIYHYFPMVIFLALMLCNCMRYSLENSKGKTLPFWIGYAAIAALLFILFYPVLTGIPVSSGYVSLLRWLDTWQLA